MLSKRILIVLMFVLLFLPLVGCFPAPTPPNETPIITSSPITTATVGMLYAYDVNATDPDGDVLIYSLAIKPTGMTINSANGLIKWTPVAAQIGNNSVTVKVSDGSLSITQPFIIKVSKPTPTPINHAPVIYSTPVTTATVGVTYIYDVNATDQDGDALIYSLTTKSSGMFINSVNGLIWWVPTAKGSYAVVVKVSDGVLFDTQPFAITVSEPTVPVVNQAPTIYSTPSLIATVGVKYTYTINAIDPEGDTITYSLSSKPTGMTFDGIATISWIPVLGQVGDNDVTVKASDGKLVTSQNFTIKVSALPPANQAPVIYSIPHLTAIVGVAFTYEVEAVDPDDGDVLTYSLTDRPKGMEIVSGTGVISWTPTSIQVGHNLVIVSVSDGDLSDTKYFEIMVDPVTLIGIEVKPKVMDLLIGKQRYITEITAHYNNESTADIALGDCTYRTNDSGVAEVDFNGLITAVAEGKATITITYDTYWRIFTDTVKVTVLSELVIADIDNEGRPVLVGTIKTDGATITFDIRAVGQADDGDNINTSKYYGETHFNNEYFTISVAGKFLKYNMWGGNTTPGWGTSFGNATNSLPTGVAFSQVEEGEDFVYSVSMSYAILGISDGDTFSIQIKARDFNDDFVSSYTSAGIPTGYEGFDGEYSSYNGLWITETDMFDVTIP